MSAQPDDDSQWDHDPDYDFPNGSTCAICGDDLYGGDDWVEVDGDKARVAHRFCVEDARATAAEESEA